MTKQIFLIKGGVAKENYKDFYDFIEKQDFNPYENNQEKRWHKDLKEKLPEKFEYFTIPMPNRYFADYKAWKIMFEKVFPYLEDETILIGYSLGGTFLVKYFEEENTEKILKKIKKIILVAPGFKDDESEVLGNFNFNKNLENLQKIQEKFVIFGSKDDFVVYFSDIEDFIKRLKKAKFRIFEDRGHFLQEDFPEIVEEIKK